MPKDKRSQKHIHIDDMPDEKYANFIDKLYVRFEEFNAKDMVQLIASFISNKADAENIESLVLMSALHKEVIIVDEDIKQHKKIKSIRDALEGN